MAQFRKDTNQYLRDGKTIFEVVMLADQSGNIIGPANPSGMAVDAFGRARVSNPFTLFDSFHRYADNGKASTANSATGSSFYHDANSGSIVCSLDTSNNSYVYRETNRVFAYQPGKSLQILNTFVLAPKKPGLRQRFGYFGAQNGFFLEVDGNDVYFVKRSFSTGTLVETRVAQADWNVDIMDGSNTGLPQPDGTPITNRNPSGLTLDLSKAQILFHDVEWLGVGSTRVGFVIDGQLIHCHSWHNANQANNTYMTTGCLPVRAEIQNTANTDNASNLRIICTTVISEGGYELRGKARSIGHEPNAVYDLTTAGTYYPVAAIRLKSERADGIVIPKTVDVVGIASAGSVLKYRVISGATVSGGQWVSAGSDSSVQYNMNATSFSGGTEFRTGYVTVTNQSSSPVSLGDDTFKYQLERNSFANTNTVFLIAVAGQKDGNDTLVSLGWEEVT